MQGQLFKVYKGLFKIDLDNDVELIYWTKHWHITPEQLIEASAVALSPSVNGLQVALVQLGYIHSDTFIGPYKSND